LPGTQIINSTPQKGEDKVTDFNPSPKHESTLGTIIPTKVEHYDGFLKWGVRPHHPCSWDFLLKTIIRHPILDTPILGTPLINLTSISSNLQPVSLH